MDVSIHDIIRGPVVTGKAYKLNKELKQLVLTVHPAANKKLVKEALKKLFNVDAKDVNIMVRKGKLRRVLKGRLTVTGNTTKKAIVTLAEGHALDFFDQAGKVQLAENEQVQK